MLDLDNITIEESVKGVNICSVYGGQDGKKRLTDDGIKFRDRIASIIHLVPGYDVRVEMRKTKRGKCLKKIGEFANMYDAHVAVYNMKCPSHPSYDPKAKNYWFAFNRKERNTLYPDQTTKDELKTTDAGDSFTITIDTNDLSFVDQYNIGEYNYNLGAFDYSDSKIDYKFNEAKLLEEFKRYVDSTYESHYSKENFQATEFVIDGGHGTGFCIGNVLKYAQRYGKKGTAADARKDIMKVLHYALIQLYIHDRDTNNDSDKND